MAPTELSWAHGRPQPCSEPAAVWAAGKTPGDWQHAGAKLMCTFEAFDVEADVC